MMKGRNKLDFCVVSDSLGFAKIFRQKTNFQRDNLRSKLGPGKGGAN